MTITYMKKPKRIITPADRRAADNLLLLWKKFQEKNPGESQESISSKLGMSQSAFSQYLRCGIALNLKATLKFAELLGVHPTEIRDDIPLPLQKQPELQLLKEPGAIYNKITDDALEVAKAWASLPPGRKEFIKDQIFFEAAVVKHLPWLQIGRPTGETYNEFEKRVEASIDKLYKKNVGRAR